MTIHQFALFNDLLVGEPGAYVNSGMISPTMLEFLSDAKRDLLSHPSAPYMMKCMDEYLLKILELIKTE
ncbi:hypothetical protein FWC63_01040 [Candidatus Saccharibacteria bacterium]|nr:hypothetical protein [Candidatus Saccharibacteria bacterium]